MDSTVTIEKVVFGGAGLARTVEGIIFVPGALPGETVAVRPDISVGGQRFATLTRVIKPSTARREPICPYYGVCGGCDFLHCSYEQQLKIKKDIFIECLNRTGKIHSVPECETVASPELRYRRRVQFKVDTSNRTVGFYKQKSHEVVAISACPLLTDPLNKLLNDIRSKPWCFHSDCNQLKAIAGDDNRITSSPILDCTVSATTISVNNTVFTVHGDSFFQNNKYLCEALGTWIRTKVSGDYCIDLYGGVGFFSVLLGQSFSSGILVESVASQVNLAQQNFAANSLNHFSTRVQPVEDFLAGCCAKKVHADCCILDPPRSGLSPNARRNLARLMPENIVYISCNPSTQARDIGYFVNSCGYHLTHCAMFDLYPNTSHLETLVLLQHP